MIGRWVGAAVCCALAAGCVTMPTERNDGISIARVADRVKCELGQAVASNPKLLSWAAVITLTLEVDQTGAVVPTANLTGPFNAGTYGLGITAGATGTSLQTSLITAYFPIWEAAKFAEYCPLSPHEPLEDSLGLKEWVNRSLDAGTEEALVFKDPSKAIGYTIEFDLDLTAGITPGFTFTRVNGQSGLSADRKTKHTLDLAMADAGIKPPHQVVNLPGETFHGMRTTDARQRPFVVTRSTPIGVETKRKLDAITQQLLLTRLRRLGS